MISGAHVLASASQNALKVARYLQAAGEATRGEIAEVMGLSTTSVHRTIGELSALQVVREGRVVSGRQGRPSATVSLCPDSLVSVGVDVGSYNTRVALVTWTGEVLASERRPTASLTPKATAEWVSGIVRAAGGARSPAATGALAPPLAPVAVGVGISGLVDHASGTAVFCPNLLGWDAQPVRAMFEECTRLPVQVDTSGRCLAVSEATFGTGRGVANQVTVAIGQGISAGIIINSAVFRGSGGFAGEVGHVTAVPQGSACTCGNCGCMENYATETMIHLHLSRKLRESRVHSLLRTLCPDGVTVTADTFRASLDAGDRLAHEHLVETGALLGTALANMANIVDPQLIVLGGGVIENCPEIVDEVRRTVRARCLNPIQRHLEVAASSLGWNGAATGAALIAIQPLLGACVGVPHRQPGRDIWWRGQA